ncbi:MAG: hypothetical protein RJB66_719 [Pseudomonadota bacterium]|jgi:hypothetical protein
MSKTIFQSLFSIFFLIVSACAPKIKNHPIPNTKPLLGPKQTDVILKFNGDSKLNEKLPALKDQTMATAELLKTTEKLILLSYQLNKPAMARLSLNLHGALYNTPDAMQTVEFERSPFADALVKEAQPQVSEKIESILLQLESQRRLISSLLDERTNPAPKNARIAFIHFPALVRDQLKKEIAYLAEHSVDPLIIESIQTAVQKEVEPILLKSELQIADILKAPTFERTLTDLDSLFVTFQYVPEKAVKEQIELGRQIARSINNMKTEQAALTLIVQFWRLMNPKERLENFKPASADLYDYLKDKDAEELDCLSSDSCLDVILLIGKKKIFSGLREYGLIKLQSTFNTGAQKFVIDQIETTLPKEISAIPVEMKKQILPRLEQKAVDLTQIKTDFEGFLRPLLKGWAKQTIYTEQAQTLPLMEKNSVRVSMENGRSFVTGVSGNDNSFNLQTVGSSLAMTSLFWKINDNHSIDRNRHVMMMRSMIEQINKLLLIYNQFPAAETPRSKKQFDALANGELIRGLSRLSYHLRDFEPTIFDLHLGRVEVGELAIESLPQELAQQQLFPKETFFALAIGNAALLLKNLNSPPSPVFTVNTEDKIQWLDKATENPETPNVMAGVVDIINGKRSQLVKSSNLSKFLISMIEFYRATEKLDQTQAPRLLEKNGDGKSNLQIILESRTDIRGLILGLSNFLSHQIKGADGITLHSINIKESIVRNTGVIYLDDQINSIEALLDSYELLQTNMYLWSAIDTFYALNKSLWNSSADFYFSDSQKTPASFAQKIATLQVISRLKNYLPPQSKEQAERILHINTQAFSSKSHFSTKSH